MARSTLWLLVELFSTLQTRRLLTLPGELDLHSIMSHRSRFNKPVINKDGSAITSDETLGKNTFDTVRDRIPKRTSDKLTSAGFRVPFLIGCSFVGLAFLGYAQYQRYSQHASILPEADDKHISANYSAASLTAPKRSNNIGSTSLYTPHPTQLQPMIDPKRPQTMLQATESRKQ